VTVLQVLTGLWAVCSMIYCLGVAVPSAISEWCRERRLEREARLRRIQMRRRLREFV
jgi:hypothetical protein